MTSITQDFTIGSEVSSRDGVCGDIRRVVVDPVAGVLTHLVVEPRHHHSDGRLVPVGLADASGQPVMLSCSAAEFDALEPAEATRFVPGARGLWSFSQDQMMSWPYYCLALEGERMGGLRATTLGGGPAIARTDRVPDGEVEIQRGDRVHAVDGDIGKVKGLIVDPRDHAITHVLLDEGHIWGQRRVAVPIAAVASVADGVRLRVTKDQVDQLPAVDLDDRLRFAATVAAELPAPR